MKLSIAAGLRLAAVFVFAQMTLAQQSSSIDAAGSSQLQQSAAPVSPVINNALYGKIQTFGFAQNLKDHTQDNNRLYLFLKQARLGTAGSYDDVTYNVQIALGGEDIVSTGSGIGLSLLDLSMDVPVNETFGVMAGQFKVPYSREALTEGTNLLFADRSVLYGGFKLGRDVGVMVHGTSGIYTGMIGVFTGGGRDVPIRYIPENLGLPMIAARVGINSGLDKSLIQLTQTRYSPSNGYAVYVNGVYTKDSEVGHSTALNVKMADKSLLLNGNWNPFIGRQPRDKGTFWQIGADAAFRTAVNETWSASGEAEVNYGGFKNTYGNVALFGGRAQASLYAKPIELGVRYSFLQPDDNFGYNSSGTIYPIVDKKLIHEITLGGSYYLKNNNLKLTFDIPVMFNVPVLNEPGIGAYVLTEQPDQVTYVAAPKLAPIDRQTVVEARMQLQFIF
ncbi:MAG: porin [Bacteroidota bacterium]